MKKGIITLLICVMVFTSAGTVFAAGGNMYTGLNGDTASKISNPELGEGEVDGLVQYDGKNIIISDDNSKNDRGQNYAWASVGYGDDVYVGTCFGAIYQTLRIIAREHGVDYSVMKKAIDVLYNGALYNGDDDKDVTENRSVLVKINTKTGKTEIVHGPTEAGGYRAAIEFHDKLYFAVTGTQPYILEIDPATGKTQIVCRSEKPQSMSIATGIRGLAVYKNQLVASLIGNNGAYMVASENPSEGQDSFKVICTQQDLLDYPAYHYMDSIFGGSIWDIVEFNDKLYFTVVTGKNGDKQAFALFSGQPDENGNWSYDLIVGNPKDGAEYPYGLGSDRSGAANLVVHDGNLYIGGYNDPMIALPDVLNFKFENIYKDLSSPVCLWRLDKTDKIEMIAGEANEVFPEGPKGNMGAGFGSNLNQYVWRMTSYNGKLYVGTFDVGGLAYPLMQFANGDVLHMSKEEWEKQINYIKILIEALKSQPATFSAEENTARIEYAQDVQEMMNIMSEMDEMYDYNAKARGRNWKEEREKFYKLMAELVEKYEEVKDQLPAEVTQSLDKVLNADNLANFKYFIETCAYLSKGERGFDLLVSGDGENFDVMTRNGFGDVYNHGCRVFAITDTGLCLGTANPYYGCQIWQINSDIKNSVLKETEGVYDKNPEGEKHKVAVGIELNGNKLTKIECNYNLLEEGKDYEITEEGVVFKEAFLSGLEKDNDYDIRFFFNVGARGKYKLSVIDTTKDGNTDGGNGDSNVPGGNGDGNTGGNGDSNAPGSNSGNGGVATGDSTAFILYAVIISASAALIALLKRAKHNR